MFKLVVLSALLAIAVARPGHISSPHVEHTVVETQGYAKVGEIVEHVPTAVSHQSSTVVHSKKSIVTPIIAPVVHQTIVAEAPEYHGHHGDAHLGQHSIVAAAPVHQYDESHYVAAAAPEHHHEEVHIVSGPVHHGESHIVAAAPEHHHEGLHYVSAPVHHGESHIVAAAPEQHHGAAHIVITVPEHHDGHYEHNDDEGHFDEHDDDDSHYDHSDNHDGHYAHEHDDHDDGHYNHHEHESYQHHGDESIVIASAPVEQHKTILVSSPVQHHESYAVHHVAQPSVVYTSPAEHHHAGAAVAAEGETKSVSKTYVAEPDSVRYTEQTHSAPHHEVKYIAAAPIVHKTIVSAPIVKYIHEEPEHHHHHW